MHEKFMQEAIRMSIDNVRSGNGGPFAALVVKEGEVIARACNEVTTHNDPTAHAEVQAIRKACDALQHYQLEGCTIYTSCEPCPMCLGAIYWARPDQVFYANTKQDAARIGFDDSFIYQELELPHHLRKIPTQQLMREEALEAFKAWDALEDKIEY